MSPDSVTRQSAWPPRRLARWAAIAVALIAVGWAAWYFGVELPSEREAAAKAAALAVQRAANARTIPDLNLDLVWIAPRWFLMGTPEQSLMVKWYYAAREKQTKQHNPEAYSDTERPVTWVTLTQPFWLGRTAVTQGQYEKVMGTNPSNITRARRDAPVDTVSWDDSMAFCQKLTEQERAAGRLPAGYAYTLPTEAQREWACRAGTTGDYAGDLDAMAWYGANSGSPQLVGMKAPNAWGLYDMEGNEWEWCRDWYADKLPGAEVTNPRGPASGSNRAMRGGSCHEVEGRCRSASRSYRTPGSRKDDVGFRVALAPSP